MHTLKTKKIIGLVGENPNDTDSIACLLRQKFDNIHCKTLTRNIRGDQLETPQFKRVLSTQVDVFDPDIVIFIRDSDCDKRQLDKMAERMAWFEEHKNDKKYKSVFLLNIQALEALILADVDRFNSIHRTNVKVSGDVSNIPKPKKFLKSQSNDKYHESRAASVFVNLNIDTIIKNCDYFKTFIHELSAHLAN